MEKEKITPLGELAVQMGFITKQQLDKCLEKQKIEKIHRPIGELLLEQNIISSAQLIQLLKLQDVEIEKRPQIKKLQREAEILSQIIIKLRYMTEQNMDLNLKSYIDRMDPGTTFMEYLIGKKLLTSDQIKEILTKHRRVIMYCGKCNKKYNILSVTDIKHIRCPNCKEFLTAEQPKEKIKGDTSYYPTMVFKNVRDSLNNTKMKSRCIICFTEFEAIPDVHNRVSCPSCGTDFEPS